MLPSGGRPSGGRAFERHHLRQPAAHGHGRRGLWRGARERARPGDGDPCALSLEWSPHKHYTYVNVIYIYIYVRKDPPGTMYVKKSMTCYMCFFDAWGCMFLYEPEHACSPLLPMSTTLDWSANQITVCLLLFLACHSQTHTFQIHEPKAPSKDTFESVHWGVDQYSNEGPQF